MRYVEDPSINACAQVETERLLRRIALKQELGSPFFVAREAVLAEEYSDLAVAYGKAVANRVVKAVQSIPPSAKPFRDAEIARRRRSWEQTHLMMKGRLPEWSLLDRLCLRLTGSPWSV